MDHADSEVLSAFAQRQCCTGFGWAVTSIVVLLLSVAILQVNDLIQLFWLGTLVNVALSITKLALAQVTAHPKALMADAVHGLGDTAAEVVTALAYVEAARPPDKEHPWGHGKIESIGAVVVTCILLYIAFSMGYDSITSLVPLLTDAFERRGQSAEKEAVDKPPESPGTPKCQSETGLERRVRRAAIAVGLASVFLKEALYHATLDAGEQVQSKLAVATAWHHRSDSLAAGVALTSQLGSALGCWPGLDPLGGGVVAAMLGHSAIDSFRDSIQDLLDYNSASGDESDESGDTRFSCGSRTALARTITRVQGVRNHTLRTRRMGPFCLVDVTIIVDARISASAASMIAESVHDLVIHDFRPSVTDVLVHVDPDGSPQSHRLETHAEANTVAEQVETLQMLNPEDLETQIRAALLQDPGDPDLPQISEVTELHTYYYMEEPGEQNDWKMSAYVDVKVDFRLSNEDIPIRKAVAAGRAARQRVRSALPGIIRDVDANLQLDIDSEEPFASPPSAQVGRACVAGITGNDMHGSWGVEPHRCAPTARLATSVRGAQVVDQDRHLQQVKLIWERGPEARKVRAPYVHSSTGYAEKITLKQMPRWHPLLVHWARQQRRDVNATVDPERWTYLT